MRNFKHRFLLFSLLVNAIVAVLLAGGWLKFSGSSGQKPPRQASLAENLRRLSATRPASTREARNMEVSFHWHQIESPDYRQYIANLRGIGCPEETIRDIVVSDVGKLYAPRLAALYSNRHAFWHTNKGAGAAEDAKRLEQYKQLGEQAFESYTRRGGAWVARLSR